LSSKPKNLVFQAAFYGGCILNSFCILTPNIDIIPLKNLFCLENKCEKRGKTPIKPDACRFLNKKLDFQSLHDNLSTQNNFRKYQLANNAEKIK
jgi:hypothetical protein